MKCNMDCEHCTRPPNKCYGGDEHTAYKNSALRPTHGVGQKSEGIKKAFNRGRKKSKGFI